MNPVLKGGDVFFVVDDMKAPAKVSWYSKIIRDGIDWIQKLKSNDNKSDTPHTGFIKPNGETFESREKISSYSMNDYKGTHLRIYRCNKMTPELCEKGWNNVKKHDGQIYPAWRFLWFATGLAKFIHLIDIPVCSELVSEFLYYCDLRHKYFMGTNVDVLEDELSIHKDWIMVFDGIWG